MKKKIAKILTGCMVAIFTFTLSGGFYFAKADEIATIKLDGQFTDWKDVPTLLTHTQSWYPNLKGTIYYWNNDTDSWQTEALPNACMYNDGRSLDLGKIKFANDSNYLYFYWEKNSDYMDYFWRAKPGTDDYVIDEASFSTGPVPTLPDSQTNQSSPPCAGEIIYNPADYDHDMVYAFDTNLDRKSDYYLVLNIFAPKGSPGAAFSYTVTSYMYKDNGNGIYDGRTTETLISDLGTDYEQYPSATSCQNGVCQEGRIKINTFFTDLGIKWGESVLVNYEAHSFAGLFKTKKSIYSFNKKNKLGLTITSPSKLRSEVKDKKVTIKARVKSGSKIRIYVNGKKKASFLATSKKFSRQVSLKKGLNIVIVKAKKGKQKVIKGVLIKRKK